MLFIRANIYIIEIVLNEVSIKQRNLSEPTVLFTENLAINSDFYILYRGAPEGKPSTPTPDNGIPKIEPNQDKTDVKKSALARREQVQENIRGYVFTRYIDYVQNYEKVLAKRFPATMRVYRVFMDGVKDFFKDMKAMLKIKTIVALSPNGLKVLTRRELELNYQMPRDMWKVAPVLLLSAIPFGHYVIFPLA